MAGCRTASVACGQVRDPVFRGSLDYSPVAPAMAAQAPEPEALAVCRALDLASAGSVVADPAGLADALRASVVAGRVALAERQVAARKV